MRLPIITITALDAVVPTAVITVSSAEGISFDDEKQISGLESEEPSATLEGQRSGGAVPSIVVTAPEVVGAVPSIIVTDDGDDDKNSTSSRLGSESSNLADLSRSSSATSLNSLLKEEEEGIISTTEITLPYHGPLGRGSLTTLAVLAKYEESSCCRFLGCSFEFELEGEERRTIGELGALVVDKSDTGIFVEEVLMERRGEGGGGGGGECGRLMRLLFSGDGDVRAGFEGEGVVALLGGERLCYIDHLSLLKAYRGRGLGRLALKSVHRVLARIGFSGPVVLSPATPAEVEGEIKGDGLTAAQREEKLVKFYRACGYDILFKGERWRAGGGITVLGRIV